MTSHFAQTVSRKIAVLFLLVIAPPAWADFSTDQTWSFNNQPNPLTAPFSPSDFTNGFVSQTNPLNAQFTTSSGIGFNGDKAVLGTGAGMVFRVPNGNQTDMAKVLTVTVLYEFVGSMTARLDSPAVTDNAGKAFKAVGSGSDTSSGTLPDGNTLRRFQGTWTDAVCPLSETVTISNSNLATLELISVEIQTACVPEPAALLSAGLGAATLGAFGWRRRQSIIPGRN